MSQFAIPFSHIFHVFFSIQFLAAYAGCCIFMQELAAAYSS
jgi:hypothetical protein